MGPTNPSKTTRKDQKSHKDQKGRKDQKGHKDGIEKKNKKAAEQKKEDLKAKLEQTNASLIKKKEELSKLNEDDPEYKKLKAEVDADGDTLMNGYKQMKTLDEDMNMDLGDIDETHEQSPVAPDASGSSQSNPISIDTHSGGTGTAASPTSVDSGGKGTAASPMSVDDDDGEERDVLTRQIYNKATGQDTDGKVVGWRISGWGKQAVVQYGPRNAALYKLLPTSRAPDFDETAVPCITKHRPGEEKDPSTKKWIRTQKDVAALQGVAIYFDSDNPKNSELTWLDLIDPERISEDDRLRYPNSICRVKWVDGTEPSFETRTTIRRLWSKSKSAGDQALFMVGKENQRRYDEWKSGQRAEEDRSPTPDPAIRKLKQEDAESRAGSTVPDSNSQRPTPLSSIGNTPAPPATSGTPAPPPASSKPAAPNASSTSTPQTKKKRTEDQFQEDWLKIKRLSRDNLEPGQAASMMDAYDAYIAL